MINRTITACAVAASLCGCALREADPAATPQRPTLSSDTSTTAPRSGQFLLDAELAELLTSGEITPPAFFLRYVEF